MPKDFALIAQMSDLHVTAPDRLVARRVDTEPFVRRAVRHVNSLDPRPDVVLVTGDLVDRGAPVEYDRLAGLLGELEMRYVLLPGNHDDREALRAAFPELPREGRLVHDETIGGLRVLCLDDWVPGSPSGTLGADQLAWLDERLAQAPATPTLVALHHPPFASGLVHMDEMGLTDREDLAQLVRRHGQVRCVVAGHLHRPIWTLWQGAVAMTSPSVAHQVVLDLTDEAPALFNFEPPAVLLHRFDAIGGLVSHVSYVGDFEGPYRFDGGDVSAL
ncbi:MAG TPA: phosphodiesterase [Acidimicrobiales bacterium]|nr:phosphodiesterase [Acidimicrobiales bacterium]